MTNSEEENCLHIIEQLSDIIAELDARERGGNCVIVGLQSEGWVDLCDAAIKLLE